MDFSNKRIIKPWGNEYELFSNENVSLWHLTIKPGQCTSLHSHPNKKTGLLVLEGAVELSFLNSKNKLLPSEKIMIRPGVFHRSTNRLSTNLELLEIETPVNKEDIIRLTDDYGRSGTIFETGQTYEDIEFVNLQCDKIESIGACKICPIKISRISELDKLIDGHNYIVLEGGIITDFCKVVAPGDISSKRDLVLLATQFTLLDSFILDIYAA